MDNEESTSDTAHEPAKAAEETETPLQEANPPPTKGKTGVIYIQTIPPLYTVSRVREVLSRYAPVGRVFLQAEKRRTRGGKKRKHYTEGWVEFARKKDAKLVAQALNGQPVGGKRRSAAYDTLWAMKYLSGFKWTHLMEQLVYERRVEEQRMRVEVSQAKRQAEHFADQVHKGEKIRRLEERMLKKGGLWERYQRQVRQRRAVADGRRKKNKEVGQKDDFLQLIFDKE